MATFQTRTTDTRTVEYILPSGCHISDFERAHDAIATDYPIRAEHIKVVVTPNGEIALTISFPAP